MIRLSAPTRIRPSAVASAIHRTSFTSSAAWMPYRSPIVSTSSIRRRMPLMNRLPLVLRSRNSRSGGGSLTRREDPRAARLR
jgi:hypothetical protein